MHLKIYSPKMGDLNFSFPGPISRKTMSLLVIDYLKYILYYRGQFPLPLDQLKQLKNREELCSHSSVLPNIDGHGIFCDDADRNSRAPNFSTRAAGTRSKQKFFEAISKFDAFFNELTRILETKEVMEIVLNLGPNLMNPKELYHILLPMKCCNDECTADYSSLQSCKINFFKSIVSSDIWADLKTDSVLPISVLLLLENGVALEEYMEQKRFYTLPKNCQHRSLRFVDKCSHIHNCSAKLAERVSDTDNSASGNDITAGLWVKLKPDLKGFKSCKESS